MSTVTLPAPKNNSHLETRERFDTQAAAAGYPDAYHETWKDRAERASILAALADVSSGSRVLDLPCGSGRLTQLLCQRGFVVTGADSSPHMVARAQENFRRLRQLADGRSARFSSGHAELAPNFQTGSAEEAPLAEFFVRDVMQTRFADREFDAVISNRLFHHFSEPAVRQRALAELARICRGPLVVSFFNSFALDSLRFRLKWLLRGRRPVDRIPISLGGFLEDGAAVGLSAERTIATRWGISPMWYVVFRPE